MKYFIITASFFMFLGFQAQENQNSELSELVAFSTNSIYKSDSSQTVAKMPLKDIENPQVYNSINSLVIQEQLVTDFNQVLQNATGVNRLWESTGRGTDGAEYYSMRGFALQPTMVNGLPNISNGTIDPINIETSEVIKGPSGTLYGGNIISYGGLININTKKPYEKFGGNFGLITGSNALNRATADINIPINTSFQTRWVSAFQSANSFQNQGYQKSLYIAPSFKIQANKRLSFSINTEFKSSESANAPMIFLSRYAPLSFHSIELFNKNYKNSFTNNDLTMKNPTYSLQAQAQYQISDHWQSLTNLSRSSTQSNGYYQYLWDSANGDEFTRFISKVGGETQTTDIQQNFIGHFSLGKFKNKMLLGLDYFHTEIEDHSSSWVANGTVSLQNQTDTGNLNEASVIALLSDASNATSVATSESLSAYISNVIYFTPKISAMASLRLDRFSGEVKWSNDKINSETTFSPKFGVVYQPILDKLSVFANYMNGFVYKAPVSQYDAEGTNLGLKTLKPEQANQWEIGTKANLYDHKISASVSYYNILVKNVSMMDPNNPLNTTQGGEIRSKGFEASIITNPIEGLSAIIGYSHNDNEVTKDNPDSGYLGLRSESAGPKDLYNFWIKYNIGNGKWKGLNFGLGMNAASSNAILNRTNIGRFNLPSYTVFDAAVAYNTRHFIINLKCNNISNQKYFSGWSTISPQGERTLSLGLLYNL